MPVRFRRRRVLIISVISIFIIFYLIDNRSKNVTNDEDDLSNKKIKKDIKPFVNQVIDESRTTTTTTISQIPNQSIREEIVDIDGKKLRKIDWHDYESIARENVRTGNVHYLFIY
jgi:hypothetical protein